MIIVKELTWFTKWKRCIYPGEKSCFTKNTHLSRRVRTLVLLSEYTRYMEGLVYPRVRADAQTRSFCQSRHVPPSELRDEELSLRTTSWTYQKPSLNANQCNMSWLVCDIPFRFQLGRWCMRRCSDWHGAEKYLHISARQHSSSATCVACKFSRTFDSPRAESLRSTNLPFRAASVACNKHLAQWESLWVWLTFSFSDCWKDSSSILPTISFVSLALLHKLAPGIRSGT